MAEVWPAVLQAVRGWLEQRPANDSKTIVTPPAPVARADDFTEAATRFLVEVEGCPAHPY